MTRSSSSDIRELDPEIERTLCKNRKNTVAKAFGKSVTEGELLNIEVEIEVKTEEV